MDNGLIQVLVIAFFIVISMMDGAARKRRKAAQSLGSLPEPNLLPGADDDLGEAAESSEPVLAKDVWEEIAALARGETPAPRGGHSSIGGPDSIRDPAPEDEGWTAPQQDVPQWRDRETESGAGISRTQTTSEHLTVRPTEHLTVRPIEHPTVRPSEEWDAPGEAMTRPADLQSGYLHPDQAASHEKHAHEKHAVVASPSRPLPEELPHEFVPHSPEPPSKPQKELRPASPRGSLLAGVRSGAKSSLREAIILAEVLSPPLTLRDSGWKPLF